jgi:hypothetical protein
MVEVVLVSGGGKSGGKSSQMSAIFLSLGCLPWWWWWWWWWPSVLYVMKVAKIGDENAAKPSSMGWCQSERFGLKLVLFGYAMQTPFRRKKAQKRTAIYSI